jgi:hypothetical protein
MIGKKAPEVKPVEEPESCFIGIVQALLDSLKARAKQ